MMQPKATQEGLLQYVRGLGGTLQVAFGCTRSQLACRYAFSRVLPFLAHIIGCASSGISQLRRTEQSKSIQYRIFTELLIITYPAWLSVTWKATLVPVRRCGCNILALSTLISKPAWCTESLKSRLLTTTHLR